MREGLGVFFRQEGHVVYRIIIVFYIPVGVTCHVVYLYRISICIFIHYRLEEFYLFWGVFFCVCYVRLSGIQHKIISSHPHTLHY